MAWHTELAIAFLRPIRDRLLRLQDKAQAEAKVRMEALKKSMPLNTISAEETASLANEDRIEVLQDMIKDTATSPNLGDIFESKPSKVLDMLAHIQNMGNDFTYLLIIRAELCVMSTKQASMGSAVSALNCWTRFALSILDYDANEVLLQNIEQHVVCFVSKSRNAGTAANYLGVLMWFCNIKNVGLHWYSDRLKMLLR